MSFSIYYGLVLASLYKLQFAPQLLKTAASEAKTDFYAQACHNCLTMIEDLGKAIA